MLKFIPLAGAEFVKNPAIAMLAAQALADLRKFYEKRPDIGRFDEALSVIKAGSVILGALIEVDTAQYRAALSYHREGSAAVIDAYSGRLSDYTASAEAFEHYARAVGATAIETDTKPAYALQTGKLGYQLQSFHWRKELED